MFSKASTAIEGLSGRGRAVSAVPTCDMGVEAFAAPVGAIWSVGTALFKAITGEGNCIESGGKGLDSQGEDVLALLSGSEGMLGIVTEVTVRLLPKPPEKRVLLAAFHEVKAAADVVGSSRLMGADEDGTLDALKADRKELIEPKAALSS